MSHDPHSITSMLKVLFGRSEDARKPESEQALDRAAREADVVLLDRWTVTRRRDDWTVGCQVDYTFAQRNYTAGELGQIVTWAGEYKSKLRELAARITESFAFRQESRSCTDEQSGQYFRDAIHEKSRSQRGLWRASCTSLSNGTWQLTAYTAPEPTIELRGQRGRRPEILSLASLPV